MVRLGQTDVWYRTVKIRRGARFAYSLSPNDPLTFDEASISRMSTAQADPLNPHLWFNNPGSTRFEYQSMVEMPDAKPQPYVAKRAGVLAGNVEKSRIKSELLTPVPGGAPTEILIVKALKQKRFLNITHEPLDHRDLVVGPAPVFEYSHWAPISRGSS